MAPPGELAGEAVPLEAPPKPPPGLRRRSLEESSMLPEAPKKHHKTKMDLERRLSIHFESIWLPFPHQQPE
jgi:hypothetical protein